jgi:hypothetical protein
MYAYIYDVYHNINYVVRAFSFLIGINVGHKHHYVYTDTKLRCRCSISRCGGNVFFVAFGHLVLACETSDTPVMTSPVYGVGKANTP